MIDIFKQETFRTQLLNSKSIHKKCKPIVTGTRRISEGFVQKLFSFIFGCLFSFRFVPENQSVFGWQCCRLQKAEIGRENPRKKLIYALSVANSNLLFEE